jgi:hypothetical protein
MKHLRSFSLFESQNPPLTEHQIEFLDDYTTGSWKYNYSTGKIDIDGSFNFFDWNSFMGLKFGEVDGNFSFRSDKIASLDGCPELVNGMFYLDVKSISNLEGSPSCPQVSYFTCANLKSLDGGPKEVWSMTIRVDLKEIQTLRGAPLIVGEKFKLTFFGTNQSSVVYPSSEWNLVGKVQVLLQDKNEKIKNLLCTLITVEEVKNSFQKDPGKTLHSLVEVWDLPGFSEVKKEIKIPADYEEQFQLMTGFNELGLY